MLRHRGRIGYSIPDTERGGQINNSPASYVTINTFGSLKAQ